MRRQRRRLLLSILDVAAPSVEARDPAPVPRQYGIRCLHDQRLRALVSYSGEDAIEIFTAAYFDRLEL